VINDPLSGWNAVACSWVVDTHAPKVRSGSGVGDWLAKVKGCGDEIAGDAEIGDV